ncbi:MAG: HlyD family efflux transporter periplasmic adaptor subunit [Planctomycetota bacterium]|nr:HlyD family efflux transporter periplasmic adaptor subunit [Planctomycetota bacterium]
MTLRYWIGLISVVLAIVAIGVSSYTIRNNTPKHLSAKPLFPPPSLPGKQLAKSESSDSTTSPLESSQYIGALGIVEPSTELIKIGTNVAGIVSRVNVRPNDVVVAGQTLIVVDDRSALARLQSAKSSLFVAKARLDELSSEIPVSRAQLASTRSALDQMSAKLSLSKDILQRREKLARESAISEEELFSARAEVQISMAQLEQAKAQLAERESMLTQLEGSISNDGVVSDGIKRQVQAALVDEAVALVNQRETEVALQSIVAPTNGTILQVKIRPGEFASAAALSDPLITIGNIDVLHVRAEIDEEEVPRFRREAKAWASARGKPDTRYPLTFIRIEPLLIPKRSLNGNVSERIDTRILQIVYRLDYTGKEVFSGQQVDVFIEDSISN